VNGRLLLKKSTKHTKNWGFTLSAATLLVFKKAQSWVYLVQMALEKAVLLVC
jgi:hypothetical protein